MPIKKSKNGKGLQRRWVGELDPDLVELINLSHGPDDPPFVPEPGHWEITTAKQRASEREWERQIVEMLTINQEREAKGLPTLTREQIDAGEHLTPPVQTLAEMYAAEHAAIEARKGLT